VSQQKEIRSLTGLRGVAAVYVMLFHFFIGLRLLNPFTIFLGHGYLAVDLFFELSGFVMALNYSTMFSSGWSQDAYLKFLGRRIARVYPLYLLCTACALPLVLLGWLEFPRTSSPVVSFLLNLVMVQSWGYGVSLDSPAWSISAEWAAYILFPLLLLPSLSSKPLFGWLTAFACGTALAALFVLSGSIVHRPNSEFTMGLIESGVAVLRCLPEFTLGLLAFRVARSPSGHRFTSQPWFTTVICSALVILMAIPKTDLVVVLIFPSLIVGLASGGSLPSKMLGSAPLGFLGLISYSVYLVHGLLGGVLGWIHHQVEVHGFSHAQTYAAAVGIVLTFPLAIVAYKTVEEPGRRWVRMALEDRNTAKVSA
jgi:peptidoglycan/LPS O-acetylase OafA/YrhL